VVALGEAAVELSRRRTVVSRRLSVWRGGRCLGELDMNIDSIASSLELEH
jgi:hypothetical protein